VHNLGHLRTNRFPAKTAIMRESTPRCQTQKRYLFLFYLTVWFCLNLLVWYVLFPCQTNGGICRDLKDLPPHRPKKHSYFFILHFLFFMSKIEFLTITTRSLRRFEKDFLISFFFFHSFLFLFSSFLSSSTKQRHTQTP